MARSESKKKLTADKIAKGVCYRDGCWTPAVPGKKSCQACADKYKRDRAIYQEELRKEGLCINGRNHGPAKEGCDCCQKCIDKSTKVATERYHDNKDADLCPYHGNKFYDESGECTKCKNTNRSIGKDGKTAYRRRIDQQLCPYCTKDNIRPVIPGKSFCIAHEEYVRILGDRCGLFKKIKVFDHYGWFCVCCFNANPKSLQIDHINGGGMKHLIEIGRSQLYGFLIKNKFPPGYQTMCSGCNFDKRDGTHCSFQDTPETLSILREANSRVAKILPLAIILSDTTQTPLDRVNKIMPLISKDGSKRLAITDSIIESDSEDESILESDMLDIENELEVDEASIIVSS